ncbi:hypothetical protein GCM10011365_25780 [Marinicella pacifica]|uniref:Uncharacterized protein n=1 Tax=Marinicella pacifica TaxID=1171543 RepID=A0A917D059_9GAMM|nr:hypothetical protein [Marinicella pacifica]GGG03487.1 hypothetical protein GCM10011365_25780 [Marinicella pacifica]
MISRNEKFVHAIKESLKNIESQGEKITISAVIKNARYENNNHVGKSTLYKKNKKNEFIHKDLLKLINKSKDKQSKKNGKKTKSSTLNELRSKIKSLNGEVQSLTDQIVTQESKLRQLSSVKSSDNATIASQEFEMYILYSLLKRLTTNNSDIYEFSTKFINKFEQKYSGDTILSEAKIQINKLIKNANDKPISLFKPEITETK